MSVPLDSAAYSDIAGSMPRKRSLINLLIPEAPTKLMAMSVINQTVPASFTTGTWMPSSMSPIVPKTTQTSSPKIVSRTGCA